MLEINSLSGFLFLLTIFIASNSTPKGIRDKNRNYLTVREVVPHPHPDPLLPSCMTPSGETKFSIQALTHQDSQ